MESQTNVEGGQEESGGYGGVILGIVVFVLVIFVVAVVWYVWSGDATNTTKILPIYTYVTLPGTSTTITPENFTAYVVPTSLTYTLTVNAPAEAAGKQFLVDNVTGGGTLTLKGGSGITIGQSTFGSGSSGICVWRDATTLSVI